MVICSRSQSAPPVQQPVGGFDVLLALLSHPGDPVPGARFLDVEAQLPAAGRRVQHPLAEPHQPVDQHLGLVGIGHVILEEVVQRVDLDLRLPGVDRREGHGPVEVAVFAAAHPQGHQAPLQRVQDLVVLPVHPVVEVFPFRGGHRVTPPRHRRGRT